MAPVLKRLFKVVTDVETSGNCPINNGVISACFLVLDKNDEVIDKKTWYVRPPELSPRTWSKEAEAVHKIPYEKVLTFMPNDQFCYELLCFLGKYQINFPMYFICHASNTGILNKDPVTKQVLGGYAMVPWFDWNFLEWAFRKAFFEDGRSMVHSFWKVFQHNEVCIEICEGKEDKTKVEMINHGGLISTIVMGRKLGYKGNRLPDWAIRLGFGLNHHDAESDTYGAYYVYKYLKAKYETYLRNQQQTGIRKQRRPKPIRRANEDVKQSTLF